MAFIFLYLSLMRHKFAFINRSIMQIYLQAFAWLLLDILVLVVEVFRTVSLMKIYRIITEIQIGDPNLQSRIYDYARASLRKELEILSLCNQYGQHSQSS